MRVRLPDVEVARLVQEEEVGDVVRGVAVLGGDAREQRPVAGLAEAVEADAVHVVVGRRHHVVLQLGCCAGPLRQYERAPASSSNRSSQRGAIGTTWCCVEMTRDDPR